MEEDTGKTGYKLRETDNRLNRMKNRQKSPMKTETLSVPLDSISDSSSRCSSTVGEGKVAGESSLSVRELRQRGLTKYDAELLLAQECSISAKHMSYRQRDRESRLQARNLKKDGSNKGEQKEHVTDGISLRNQKRLSEHILDTSSLLKEKVNNNNNDLSDFCSVLDKTKVEQHIGSKLKRTEVSKKENEKSVALVGRVSRHRVSIFKQVNDVLDSVYLPVNRPKRTLGARRLRVNSVTETHKKPSEQTQNIHSSEQPLLKLLEEFNAEPLSNLAKTIADSLEDDQPLSNFQDSIVKPLPCLDVAMDQDHKTKPKQCVHRGKDIYEFDDHDCDEGNPEPLRRSKLEDKSDVHHSLAHSEETRSESTTPEKPQGGRLKLTLRVKRSPITENSSESGLTWEEPPEYEVLRVEGVGDLREDEQNIQRRKKHKNKEKRRRKLREYLSFEESGRYQPPMKRLRLILGNETQTIHLPQVVPPVL